MDVIMNGCLNLLLKNIFPIQLMITYSMFCPWHQRRKYWWISHFGGYLIGLLASNLIPVPQMVILLMNYCLMCFFSLFTFKVSIIEALFVGTNAYALQFVISSQASLEFEMLSNLIADGRIAFLIKNAISTCIALPLCYLFFIRLIKKQGFLFHNLTLVITSFTGLIVFIVLSYIFKNDPGKAELSMVSINAVYILYILFGWTILIFNYNNLIFKNLQDEKQILTLMLQKDKLQYESTKNMIERINIREHDLRHKQEISELTEEEKDDLEFIRKSNLSRFATGNQSIDILLSQYAYLCAKNDINLICSIDGHLLDFMKPYHISSIFGNALLNAYEYLSKINDVDKKTIRVSLQKNGEQILLTFSNYLKEKLIMVDNLPVTTHKHKEKHGLGIKSIMNVVSINNGYCQIIEENHTYTLMILFEPQA